MTRHVIRNVETIVAYDEKTGTLFCARDRVGIKPFYYTLAGGSFLFASEIKALLQWPGFS